MKSLCPVFYYMGTAQAITITRITRALLIVCIMQSCTDGLFGDVPQMERLSSKNLAVDIGAIEGLV